MTREQILNIKDLKVDGIVDKMDDGQFEGYCYILDLLVEEFPEKEARIKRLLAERNTGAFCDALQEIKETLIGIHATSLADDCLKLAREAETGRYERVEAYLTYFLTSMSALSIDIQMAQSKTIAGAPQSEKASAGEPKVILAVDDSPLMLNSLKSIMSETEYKFTGVASGAAALKFIASRKPDLFLLDIEMPEMDGYELAGRIKAAGHTAPIIFLTGNAEKEYVYKAIMSGAVDFIVKPINRDLVLEKLKSYIG